MKKISLIVAAYKAEQWLKQCVTSIHAQSLPKGWELEVLLGIDGCPMTLSVAKDLQARDTKVISMKNNTGPYITFNTLMQFTSGELIGRFDADDVMMPGYLLEQIKRLEKGGEVTRTWCIYTDKHLQPNSTLLTNMKYIPPNCRLRHGLDGQFIMKRHVWEMIGAFRAWRCAADTDFVERIRIKGFITEEVKKFLYYHRVHSDSLTVHPATNFQSNLRKDYIKILNRLRQEYRQSPESIEVAPVYGEISHIFE